MFNVYDAVWIMENNEPVKKIVFAVITSMNHSKDGIETHLQLVESLVGAGWGNNKGTHHSIKDVYIDKETLLRSL